MMPILVLFPLYIRMILLREKIFERKICWLYVLEMDSDELLEFVFFFVFFFKQGAQLFRWLSPGCMHVWHQTTFAIKDKTGKENKYNRRNSIYVIPKKPTERMETESPKRDVKERE